MNVGTLLTIITSTFVLGGLLGGFINSTRKGNDEKRNEIIQLQQTELATLKDSNQRLSADNKALSAKVEVLEKSNKNLKSIAQQTPEIKKLIKVVSELVVKMGTNNG